MGKDKKQAHVVLKVVLVFDNAAAEKLHWNLAWFFAKQGSFCACIIGINMSCVTGVTGPWQSVYTAVSQS